MNRSLLRTLPLFLVSLVLTMTTPLVRLNETSPKPPFDPITLTPIITEIHESKRTVLLMASLPTRLLVIVSAPGSTSLTNALVFEQSPESLRTHPISSWSFLTMHLETEPQLLTQKWPKLKNLTGDASYVALRDAYQSPEPSVYLSANEYLLIGDAGKLTFLNLDTGDITERTLGDVSLYDRLFKNEAILLSTFHSVEPLTFIRLLPRGSTNVLKPETVTFSSTEGRLPSFESFNVTEGPENYICPSGLNSHAGRCGKRTNWSITYGFRKCGYVYLNDALTSSLIRTSLFYDKPVPDIFYSKVKGAPSVSWLDFWALPQEIEASSGRHSESYRIYLAIGLTVVALLGVAFVAFKYGCKGKLSSSQGASSKKKKSASRSRSKRSNISISRSKRSKTGSSGKSKKGSSSSAST